jgi:hypothetical protein
VRDYLPPIFDILTGLGFLLVLVVGVFARAALKPLYGRLIALSLAAFAFGFQMLSQATGATSIGAGGELFLIAGASFFLGALLVTAGLFLLARATRVSA